MNFTFTFTLLSLSYSVFFYIINPKDIYNAVIMCLYVGGGVLLNFYRNLLKLFTFMTLLITTSLIGNSKVFAAESNSVSVQYQTHVQNVGWQDFVTNNSISGTSGQSLRLEGIRINLLNPIPGMKIKYQTHVQNVGWQDWKYDGEMSGTSGQSLRLEGIRIVLENAPKGYHIQYKTHVQNVGWQNWSQDGELAGTTGMSLRLEAIVIKIIAPSNIDLSYKSHVQNVGWQGDSVSPNETGVPGGGLRLEAITINFVNPQESLKIKYQTHVQNVGWQNWVYAGQASGTSGQSLRIEGIKIMLENQQPGYHVTYNAYVEGLGWLGWVSDGELSGTTGRSLKIEALKIYISKEAPESIAPPTPKPLAGKTVIVDPGHGGFDPGAISGNVSEETINLSVSLKLKSLLEQSGASVVMTRSDDTFVDLYNRPAIAHKQFLLSRKQSGDTTIPNLDYKLQLVQQVLDNRYTSSSTREDFGIYKLQNGLINNELKELMDAEKTEKNIIFISIHSNSSSLTTTSGPQVYYVDSTTTSYYKGYNDAERQDLSNKLFNSIKPVLNSTNTAARVDNENYAVIREQNLPSALIEMGFMTNATDLNSLTNDSTQTNIAKAINTGIMQFFSEIN